MRTSREPPSNSEDIVKLGNSAAAMAGVAATGVESIACRLLRPAALLADTALHTHAIASVTSRQDIKLLPPHIRNEAASY